MQLPQEVLPGKELNRLYETLDGETELKEMGGGCNRLKFKAMHGGHIFISGTLSMNENGQSYEMTFYHSIDQTFFRDFANALYRDHVAHTRECET